MKYFLIYVSFFVFSPSLMAQVPSGDFEKDMREMRWQSKEYIHDSLIFKRGRLFMERCGEIDSCNTPRMHIKKGSLIISFSDFSSHSYSYRYDAEEKLLKLTVDHKSITYKVSYVPEEYGYSLIKYSTADIRMVSYSAVTDLKTGKWVCGHNFTSSTLSNQKSFSMSVCSNDLSTYTTPVMWIEGEDFIIHYPDGYVSRMKYYSSDWGNYITIYPTGYNGSALRFSAVYVSTGNFFSLTLQEDE